MAAKCSAAFTPRRTESCTEKSRFRQRFRDILRKAFSPIRADIRNIGALRAAAEAMGDFRLTGCDLVVTLEPCPMCAHAISLFRVRRLIFGAYDPKGGGVEHGARVFDASSCHHRPDVIGGVRETDAGDLLRAFFAALR